jgi:DNA polymerase III alpha subunit (gram-positive type)
MTDMEIDPRLEKIVWRSLGMKSVRQISEETGLAPEQIFAIKREMLDSVDVLTVQEKRTKILVAMEQLAQDALDRADGASDEFAAGMLNAARGAMKDMLTEFNRASKQDQGAIEQLNQLRIREILRLVDGTVARTFAEISETYGIEEDELLSVFQRHLKPAAEELEG